jgi:pterin-4a-carbinolamine dehydratase
LLPKQELPEQEIQIGESFTLQDLTQEFTNNLPNSKNLSSFEELQAKVELTGGYLTMYQLFTRAIASIDDTSKKANINKHHQELLMQYNQLRVSLEAVDDDFLDNVATPCSDPLFLRFLTDFTVKTWTNQILSDQAPVLTDSQVQQLIDAWGTAVTKFVEDARKDANVSDPVKPGQSTTIAHFFCIHDQLEGLYSELSTSVALNS